MNKPKRKRLVAAGWKVGGAGELLGLSKAEAVRVEARLPPKATGQAPRRRPATPRRRAPRNEE